MSRARSVVLVALVALMPGAALAAHEAVLGEDDAYDAPHAGLLEVPAADGVLANDVGAVAAELWTEPARGSVELAADGGFRYERAELAALDRFSYLPVPADGPSGEPVTVTIRFANAAPACQTAHAPDAMADAVDEPVEFDLATVCADADGDPMRFSYQRPDVPDGSGWQADPTGWIRFLPPPGWTGTATVLFTADDGMVASMPVAFVVRVVPAAP